MQTYQKELGQHRKITIFDDRLYSYECDIEDKISIRPDIMLMKGKCIIKRLKFPIKNEFSTRIIIQKEGKGFHFWIEHTDTWKDKSEHIWNSNMNSNSIAV